MNVASSYFNASKYILSSQFFSLNQFRIVVTLNKYSPQSLQLYIYETVKEGTWLIGCEDIYSSSLRWEFGQFSHQIHLKFTLSGLLHIFSSTLLSDQGFLFDLTRHFQTASFAFEIKFIVPLMGVMGIRISTRGASALDQISRDDISPIK